tara:strand:+ start:852 stop:998 length:147 start_codon:yes stop_codon:yes gene_type:complete
MKIKQKFITWEQWWHIRDELYNSNYNNSKSFKIIKATTQGLDVEIEAL